MLFETIAITIAFTALIAGTITDLKSREVPDWLNYGLMFAGVGLRLLFFALETDYSYLINGAAGFLVFWVIALIMFYTGQWGGGDSKMIMGLGVLFGVTLDIENLMISFFINAIVVGAAYGLIWSVFLAIKKGKVFKKEFNDLSRAKIMVIWKRITLILAAATLIAAFILSQNIVLKILLITTSVVLVTTIYLFIFIKTIEKVCMIKDLPINKITEGDWIVEEVKLGKKVLVKPDNEGISREDIALLKKHIKDIKTVKVKEGIPFVPSFLITMILTLYLGNFLLLLLSI